VNIIDFLAIGFTEMPGEAQLNELSQLGELNKPNELDD
jgi:hypothetical protein